MFFYSTRFSLAGCLQALHFHTVCAANVQTWLNGYSSSCIKKTVFFVMFFQKDRNLKISIAFLWFLSYNERNIEMQSRFICVKCFPDRESLERRKE